MAKFEIGGQVVLTRIPPGLLYGLPEKDQAAIRAIVGQPVTLADCYACAAELEFTDADGDNHSIWVHQWYLAPNAGMDG